MRVGTVALSVFGAILTGVLALASGGASAATTTLQATQECLPDGRLAVRFDWAGNDPTAHQQWLDLSLVSNGWEPGTFIGGGPVPGTATSLTWQGLLQGETHYVRVNQLLPNGAWDPSPLFVFVAGVCPGAPVTPPPPAEDRIRVPAPIESAEIAIVGTPGGYAVRGVAGLPGGCAQPGGSEVMQSGSLISVKVYNTVPSGNAICTLIYGYYDYVVGLGNVTPGTRYTVDVNGTVLSFTADGNPTVPPAMPNRIEVTGRIPDLTQTVPPGEGEAGRITVGWGDASNNETGFRVYQACNGAVTQLAQADADTISIGPLQPCRPGQVGVAAFNEAGESAILWLS